jgi:hypothetical protein
MDIEVIKPGGEPAMQFMVPCYEAGHSNIDNGRYNELDSVIAVQKGYVGSSPHVELVERVQFVFTDGVLSDFTAQYKHSYYIRNANDELYEITVDGSGQVVATKVDS